MHWRSRPHQPRASAATRALIAARSASGLSLVEVGRALDVNPRTVRRWELGAAIPRARQIDRLLAFFAVHAPNEAHALAVSIGRDLPARTRVVEPNVAIRVVARAADALDVSPKRVREVLREASIAAVEAGIGIEWVVRALMDEAEQPREPSASSVAVQS